MIRPIQILNDLIASTAHTLKVSQVVDNLDGTYTLDVNFTYYLNSQRTITINSVSYRVVSFVLNESITIKGDSLPVTTSFDIDSPRFLHGTPKKVNGEMINEKTKSYPFIWLLEFLEADYDDNFNSAITVVLDLNLFFLTDVYEDNWDINAHYSQAIDPMANEIDFFIRTIQKRRDLFGEIEGHNVTNHVNFGEYIVNKGYDNKILSDNLSGSQLKLSLPYVVDVCIGDLPIISKCAPVSIYKDLVFEEFVPSGGRFDYTQSVPCDDGTVTTKDSEDNILYNTLVPSGGAVDRVINDGVNTFNGNPISGILAQGIKSIVLQTTDAIPVQVGTVLIDTKGQLTIEVNAVPPPPATGSFISLSWTGSRVGEYDFAITNTESCNYNTITRKAGAQTFVNNIFSVETMSSDDNWSISGDLISATGNAYMIGFGLKSDTGLDFPDLDFALFVNSLSLVWYESGVSSGTIATLTVGKIWSYRIEHTSGTVKVYIDNALVHTTTTSYSSDTLAVKLNGRNQSLKLTDHLVLINTATPNRFLGAIGDSITFGRASQGLKNSNYIEQTLIGIGNTYFTTPFLALNNYTTALVISNLLPLVPPTYDVTRDKNVYSVMIGINDLRASVPLVNIQNNITTIVNSLQSTGFMVVLHTVLRDFTNDWADRYTLNSWIIANSVGADYINDHTGSIIETDSSYYEVDLLHPNPAGMQIIADDLVPIINSI